MFRSFYAKIGLADSPEKADEEESLAVEETPPTTPQNETAAPKLNLSQPSQPIPHLQGPAARNSPLPTRASPLIAPPPNSSSPSFPPPPSSTTNTNSPGLLQPPPSSSIVHTSSSGLTIHAASTRPGSGTFPQATTPPGSQQPSPAIRPPLNTTAPQQASPHVHISPLANSSPAFLSTFTSANSTNPTNSVNSANSAMPRTTSNPTLLDMEFDAQFSQLRTSSSPSTNPYPLLPTQPLASTAPSPQPASSATTDSSGFGDLIFPDITPAAPVPGSQMKRVTSFPHVSTTSVVPNTGRRNSNTPSPLSQPWPSRPASQLSPTHQPLIDLDDEEESDTLLGRAPQPAVRPQAANPPQANTQPQGRAALTTSATSLQTNQARATPPPTTPPTAQSTSSPATNSPKPTSETATSELPAQEVTSKDDWGFPSNERSLAGSGQSNSEFEEEVLKEGWMTKQDKAKQNWVKRFFALTATSLYYYEGEGETLRGKILLESYDAIIVDPEEIEKEFCFMLTHPTKRVFYIHCESREEMLPWIIAIADVVDKLKPVVASVKMSLVPIAETDPKYELVYAMLHAIRFSVSKVAALPYLDIGLEELNASVSHSADKQSSVLVSNYPYSFVDYAPKAFRKMRELFGFKCADYLLSLTSQYTLSELPTPGKSGSFFYYSNDRKFMLKTISATEFDNLRQMLPNYFLHILQNPNTLLTRLFGLHKISTENSRSIFFVVMENIFLDYEMEETYDLKGSTIGRKSDGTSAILKDLDWKRRILLDCDRRSALLFQLELDCKFLEKNNIMDYSFLLGLRFISHQEPEQNKRPFSSIFQKEKGGFQATTEEKGLYDIVYYFGIIDIFTTYNIKKQLEHTYKSTIYETKDAISVVDASKYAHRFRKFIGSITGWKSPEKAQ